MPLLTFPPLLADAEVHEGRQGGHKGWAREDEGRCEERPLPHSDQVLPGFRCVVLLADCSVTQHVGGVECSYRLVTHNPLSTALVAGVLT